MIRESRDIYIALLEVVDGMGQTMDHDVAIDAERCIILNSCSEIGIGLIPAGIYFCVGSATFRGISELRELKRLAESKGRKDPMKRKRKKVTEDEKQKSTTRLEHSMSMTVHRSFLG